MKKETRQIIEDIKILNDLTSLFKQNTIDLDNYFRYSGMQEHQNNIIDMTPSYRKKEVTKVAKVCNDMSKYKLKNYKKYE
tara:strand:+ start:362 stop:601 length:240 start_codon:yes stop_codon:yes gene_type:complete